MANQSEPEIHEFYRGKTLRLLDKYRLPGSSVIHYHLGFMPPDGFNADDDAQRLQRLTIESQQDLADRIWRMTGIEAGSASVLT